MVAPFAGAWIEILYEAGYLHEGKHVAPFAGAWIEIIIYFTTGNKLTSHPSRVRGLKLPLACIDCDEVASHPSRVRGLKF